MARREATVEQSFPFASPEQTGNVTRDHGTAPQQKHAIRETALHLHSRASGTPTTSDVDPMMYESAAREAGRRVARQIPKVEYDNLVAEHQKLAVNEVLGNITRSDSIRLRMIRWKLDQIEDARYGHVSGT